MNKFSNLHVNTEYSLLESTIKIDSLILYAKNHNLSELVITDHNSMYGVAEFIHKCLNNNIKPIIGIDLDVEDFRLILLAKNYTGYKHLMFLSSMKGKQKKICISDINSNDIFVIDHPSYGYYAKKKLFLNLNNYFVGLSTGELANGVAIQETKIIDTFENKALTILHSIKTGKKQIFNYKPFNYIKKTASDSMLKKSIDIAKQCNVIFPEFKLNLPNFFGPDNMPANLFIKKLLKKNFLKKLKHIEDKLIYEKRINQEMQVIEKLKFVDYFLII
jgi:DNA polymerase-3 subunit alpha